VGITAKPVSVVALKDFNPRRYADLSFSNPLPLDDPGNCSKVGRDSERTTENGLVWDIFTQVGAWMRSREPSNPLNYGIGKYGKHSVQYLKKLYPNHEAYVNSVARNLSSLVSQRFVTKAEAKRLMEEAKRASIP
jgi:hypothetical protein